jgi:D-sedoheptulose 7-phosphate isomerase
MSFPQRYKSELLQAVDSIDLDSVQEAIEVLRRARDNGRRIFTCGNGGSASTASHFVCDIIKGASFGREKRFKIMALTDSLSTLTAYSNDVNYECVFVEQLKNHAEPGDVLISISGSGNSSNVLRAMEYANSIGVHTIALSGRDGGKMGPLAKTEVRVKHPHMGRIEDAHMIVLHMIGYYFMEEETAKTSQSGK